MTTTYVKQSSDSGLGVGDVYTKQLLEETYGTLTEELISVGSASSVTGKHIAQADDPGADGQTGDFTVEVNVTVGSSDIQISVRLQRLDETLGAVQAQTAYSAEQTANAGVLTFNFTAADLGTWGSGERLAVQTQYRNTHQHTARDVTVGWNTADSEVVAPWGVVQFTGDAAQTLSSLTQDASGTHTAPSVSGTAEQTLGSLSQDADGTSASPSTSGTATQTLPLLSQSADGTHTAPSFTGTADQTLPSLTQSASGSLEASISGTADQTLPVLFQDADGTSTAPTFSGSAEQSLPSLTQDASGTVEAPEGTGTAAQTLPSSTQTAAGSHDPPVYTATASQTFPSLTQDAAGTVQAPGEGAASQTLPSLTQTATGTIQLPTLTGTLTTTLPAITQTAFTSIPETPAQLRIRLAAEASRVALEPEPGPIPVET